jgi:hypothetical protein
VDGFSPPSSTAQLNAVFGQELRSPRHSVSQQKPPQDFRGPVPRFTKCTSLANLHPKVNNQPPFRRANPDGGFLSVSNALSSEECHADDVGLLSLCKHSPLSYPRHTEYAILTSNMNRREIREGFSQSLARVSRMMATIMKIVTIFSMSTIFLALKTLGTSESITHPYERTTNRVLNQEPLPDPGCPRPGNVRTSREMPESSDTGSCSGQSCEE